jgi:hypothetical protein
MLSAPRGRNDERGEIGLGILLAVTLTLVVAVGIVNIFMFLYGQSVLRSALDEGVRAGSRVEAGAAVCLDRAHQVLDDLLGGDLGDDVTLVCAPGATPGELVAIADATFSSPMPGVPSWTFRLEARATQELAATP